jgi:DNA topoisomerase I
VGADPPHPWVGRLTTFSRFLLVNIIMPKLVIVESPTKARTIRGFLPAGYEVQASMGHVRDLPESASDIPEEVKGEEWSRLGVNVHANFEPLYVIPKDKRKVVKQLKEALKKATS